MVSIKKSQNHSKKKYSKGILSSTLGIIILTAIVALIMLLIIINSSSDSGSLVSKIRIFG